MKLITIIFLLICSSVFAADFRTLNFGDNCKNVVELEAALGSQQIPLLGNNMIRFSGHHIARIGKIDYTCSDDGIFESGSILYKTETLEQAKVLYNNIKQVLITEYGKPLLDGGSGEYPSFMKSNGIKMTKLEKTQLMWYFENFSIIFYMVFPKKGAKEAAVIMLYSNNKNKI